MIVLCALRARPVQADSEKIAMHPLVVPEVSEKEELEYRKLFRAEVARLEPGVAAAAEVRAFLKGVPHQTCVSAADLDKCLAELAKGIGARRAVFVSLYLSPRIRLSGRIVRDTGEVRVAAEKEYGRRPRKRAKEAIRKALQQFLVKELGVGEPDLRPSAQGSTIPETPQKPEGRETISSSTDSPKKEVLTEPALPQKEAMTEPTMPAPIDAPVPAPPSEVAGSTSVEASRGWSWQKTTGVSFLAAGSVAAGLGIYFRVQASNSWSDFNSFSRQTPLLTPSQLSALKSIQSTAQSRQNTGSVLLIGGGTLVVAGATMLILELTKPPPLSSMSIAVVPYPVGLAVAGGFQ